jgi:hypothetical protein
LKPSPSPIEGIPIRKLRMNRITFQDLLALEYYEMNLAILERERQKITRRGPLTPAEDERLNAIDAELDHWADAIELIDPDYFWIDDCERI